MNDFITIISDQKDELRVSSKWISRQKESAINLDSDLAQIVIGVRRSGKSTLCMKRLLESGVNFAYVNFDDERFLDLSPQELNDVLSALYRVYGNFTHLFLDEVQNIKGWHLFVNRLLRQGIKMILTGSNANLLSSELSTHLTGRYNQIELYPFSFSEFCDYHQTEKTSLSTKAQALRMRLLDEYMERGGFPELLSENSSDDYIPSLLHAILFKDICKRYKIRYPDVLERLANILLDNYCQEISYNKIAKTLNVSSVHTVQRYIDYLSEAYLTCNAFKFSFKSMQRQTNRKAYAIDPTFVLQRGNTIMLENKGWMIENIVYLELRRRFHKETQSIFYIRQTDFEVDFVVSESSHILQLIQVTYNWSTPSAKQIRRELGGLTKGSTLTHCNNLLLIIYDGQEGSIDYEGKSINIIKAANWLSGDLTLNP